MNPPSKHNLGSPMDSCNVPVVWRGDRIPNGTSQPRRQPLYLGSPEQTPHRTAPSLGSGTQQAAGVPLSIKVRLCLVCSSGQASLDGGAHGCARPEGGCRTWTRAPHSTTTHGGSHRHTLRQHAQKSENSPDWLLGKDRSVRTPLAPTVVQG